MKGSSLSWPCRPCIPKVLSERFCQSLSSLSKAILQHHSILQCHGHSTVSWTPYSVIGTIQCHRHPKMSWTLYSVMNITRKYHGHPTVSQTFYLVTGTLQCHGYSTLLAFIIAYCEFSERLLVFFIYNCFLSDFCFLKNSHWPNWSFDFVLHENTAHFGTHTLMTLNTYYSLVPRFSESTPQTLRPILSAKKKRVLLPEWLIMLSDPLYMNNFKAYFSIYVPSLTFILKRMYFPSSLMSYRKTQKQSYFGKSWWCNPREVIRTNRE